MFRPQYRYTHMLVENLLRAENARAAIDVAQLADTDLRDLRARAHKANVAAAEALDGIMPPGLAGALTQASASASAAPDEQSLGRLQSALIANGGGYRLSTKLLYDGAGELTYVPPDASEVAGLMSALADWLADSWDALPAVALAGITMQELLLIQPFEAHNGALARLAGDAVLWRKGYGFKGCASVDATLAGDLEAFDHASRSSHTGVHPSQADFTHWLEFFTGAVARAAGQARDEVLARAKRPDSAIAPDLPAVLRDRQLKAMHYIRDNGAIRSGEYQRLVGIVPDTARRDFDELMEKGLIEVRGVGRGTHYVLTRRGVQEVQRRRPA